MLYFVSSFLAKLITKNASVLKLIKILNRNSSLLKKVYISVKGSKMSAHSFDRLVALIFWKFSILEKYESSLLKSLIKKDMVVIDIGANIGYYTLLFSKWIGNGGTVYAFEPDPENYNSLLRNIKKNSTNNIKPFKIAVSDKTQKLKLYISKIHKGNHKTYNSYEDRNNIEIEAVALDDFFKGPTHIDLIKMDIEGYEYFAFNGMLNILNQNKNIKVVLEFFPEFISSSGASEEKFLSEMISNGFIIYNIDEKNHCLQEYNAAEILNICKTNKYTSLYLSREKLST